MALVVTVVLRVLAVILCLAAADEVDCCPFGRLEFLPEFGSPADDLGYGVAEGHVADGCVGRCALAVAASAVRDRILKDTMMAVAVEA